MDKKKISERIRALRAKTVANGCTEEEAAAAAAMVAKLLARYNMTLDETELKENAFAQARQPLEDILGRSIHKIANAIAYMMDIRYWKTNPGEAPAITFFGFSHEVEIATYLLDICRNAMKNSAEKIEHENRLLRESVKRRRVISFLDGMADRLAKRIRALKPQDPPGTGLIVLRGALIDAELERLGHQFKKIKGRSSWNLDDNYERGRNAADKVALNKGIKAKDAAAPLKGR